MRISKHTFQDYCDDSKKAQKLMSMVASKLPTKTMAVTISRRYNTTHSEGMATIATVDAMDVLALCDRMISNKHHKVNHEPWYQIRAIAHIEINKVLAEC